jgi:hypothetical protein
MLAAAAVRDRKKPKHCYYSDDLTLLDTSASSSSIPESQTIKLHSKVIKAVAVLNTINMYLVNSTMTEIINHKPTFDREKIKLMRLQSIYFYCKQRRFS